MSSSRLSVNDILMSSPRTAAKKKKTPTPQTSTSSHSRKKMKVCESKVANLANDSISDSAKQRLVTPSNSESSLNSKALSQKVKIQELKSKIGLLKEKPNDFNPEKVFWWKKGEKVPFMFLSLAFDLISTQSGQIVITDILCNMLRTVIATTPEDLVATVYLAANEISPAHEGLVLGISDDSIIKSLSKAYSVTVDEVMKQNKELGGLWRVVELLVAKGKRSSQTMVLKPQPLTVVKVLDKFLQIAKESGKDSAERKKNRMWALLMAATEREAIYLTRLLQGILQLGFSGRTVLAALGQAAVYIKDHSKPPTNTKSPLEEAAKIVKQVFTVFPDYGIIVPALLTGGVWNLPKNCNFTLGIPIGSMLSKPNKDVKEILNKFQNKVFTCEYKYDGVRAQIHYMEDGTFKIYSRNGKRNTEKYPDVILALSRLKKPSVKSFILDCEVVAFDRTNNKILTFKNVSTRAHTDVKARDIKVPVCIFAFDMLYLNGQQLIHQNLNIRREKLYGSFKEDPGYFQFTKALTSSNIDEIQKFFNASVEIGCEGLVIKSLNSDATYEPAKYSNNWLKLKKDYRDSSIGDSLDLVPIGADHGKGKRKSFYGSILLACYDVDNEEYQSISYLGSGFSDTDLKEFSSRLKVIDKPQHNYRVNDSTKPPDVWFESTEVWEVKVTDLTISPQSLAAIGIVDPNKGISLRSPRFLRVREDKTPEEATTSEQVAEMFLAQKQNHLSNQTKGGAD